MPLVNIDGVCNCLSARKAARYITAIYDKALAPTGIRITQFTILHKVGRVGPLSVKQLAIEMAMDRTTVAANLKPLEREGLLCQVANEKDRRSKLVRITDIGREKLEECLPLWRNAQTAFEEAYGLGRSASMRKALADVLKTGFDPWSDEVTHKYKTPRSEGNHHGQ